MTDSNKIKILGYNFGHEIYCDTVSETPNGKGVYEVFRYVDTDEIIDGAEPRKCKQCGMYPTADGHDPCIANLPGVKYACCGHGIKEGVCNI